MAHGSPLQRIHRTDGPTGMVVAGAVDVVVATLVVVVVGRVVVVVGRVVVVLDGAVEVVVASVVVVVTTTPSTSSVGRPENPPASKTIKAVRAIPAPKAAPTRVRSEAPRRTARRFLGGVDAR